MHMEATTKRARKAMRRCETKLDLRWAGEIKPEEWVNYVAAMEALRSAGIPFMLGGGFAQGSFSGRWRHTKDIDFYILPEDRDAGITALTRAGFVDYYSTLPYDREWIYRSTRDGVLVDIIWAMANQRARVDASWTERATHIEVRDQRMLLLGIEEFMWCKLYIVQRDRCDWIDVLNLLYTNGETIDWDHLIGRLGSDTPLLQAVLTLFGWVHPERAALIPQEVREELHVPPPIIQDAARWKERARWLDSRVWFAASRPEGERLEI